MALRARVAAAELARGIDVHAYFQHEDAPTGPRYAARLRERVDG